MRIGRVRVSYFEPLFVDGNNQFINITKSTFAEFFFPSLSQMQSKRYVEQLARESRLSVCIDHTKFDLVRVILRTITEI